MSVDRFSFNDTPDWLDAIGFINRISLETLEDNETIILKKGGLVFGFKQETGSSYGYVINGDVELSIELDAEAYFITCDIHGAFNVEIGDYSLVRGFGANIEGVPWYTYNGNALVGKVFKSNGIVSGYVICDDPYWCEL